MNWIRERRGVECSIIIISARFNPRWMRLPGRGRRGGGVRRSHNTAHSLLGSHHFACCTLNGSVVRTACCISRYRTRQQPELGLSNHLHSTAHSERGKHRTCSRQWRGTVQQYSSVQQPLIKSPSVDEQMADRRTPISEQSLEPYRQRISSLLQSCPAPTRP